MANILLVSPEGRESDEFKILLDFKFDNNELDVETALKIIGTVLLKVKTAAEEIVLGKKRCSADFF